MLLYSWDRGLDVCVDLTGSSHLTQTGRVDFVPGQAVINAAQRKRGKYMAKTRLQCCSPRLSRCTESCNPVHNDDSDSDNNTSDSSSTSQISTSKEIDYDSREYKGPPKSLLKWYGYLSNEYKDKNRLWVQNQE
nr:hypothetical protein [Tanacetum cinerariifolium]